METIKNELNNLENDLLSISKVMKKKYLKKLKFEFELKEKTFKYFEENFFKEIQKARINGLATINEENLKKNLYLCHDFLNELNNYNLNFYENLRHVSFNPSKWFPSLNIIGELIRIDLINIDKLRYRAPKLISLDKKIKSLNRLWNFNDEELFLTGCDDNKILILDNHFNIINEITDIEGLKLCSPLGICSDNIENIYVCDYGNHRVLIIDQKFTKVKKIIGKRGSAFGEFVDPLDICFNSNCLYVLDRELKRVQEFTRNGDFVREIKLYEILTSSNSSILYLNDRKLLTRPVRMCISNGLIAILDSFKKVYIYNLRGEFKHVIDSNINMLMCLISEYLFTCNRDGIFVCYQRNQIFHNYKEFKILFERSIDCLKSSKSYMHFFDDQLVFLLTDDNAIAIL